MVTDISISVRHLVEFLLRTGDLDNRASAGGEDAMQEGSRMHRKIQQSAGDGYQAEVTLRLAWTYDKRLNGVTGEATDMLEEGDPAGAFRTAGMDDGANGTDADERMDADAQPDYTNPRAWKPYLDDATVNIEGRADGIYYNDEESRWTVDEIKTTYRKLSRIKRPEPVHLAQAKCYAYMYAVREDLPRVGVRMTYVNLYDGSIKYFHSHYTRKALHKWFAATMEEYRKWAEYTLMWQLRRTASIRDLTFPYEYREGQRQLVAAVYQTINRGRKLFLEAPTGTGKTIATLYPSIRAMGEAKASRIFYLTAKTITRTAAEHAIEEMRGQGLLMKSVVLTARDKICVLEHPDCNPRTCPRAKGHYDRINAALFDLLTHEDAFTRENIERYAAQYNVCPFEMGLDIALFADTIIGDYNYLFDPHAYLRRFFGENGDKGGDYIFLVDEAHNLLDRGREMYSATLCKEDLLLLKRRVSSIYPGLVNRLTKMNTAMLQIKKETMAENDADAGEPCLSRLSAIDQLTDAAYQLQIETCSILTQERILELNGRFAHDPMRQAKLGVRDDLLDTLFNLNHFLLITQGLDERYLLYSEIDSDGRHTVHLYNADPSMNLQNCMARGRASILFSATFLPIQYYKSLLGGTAEDYEIYAQSVFDPARRRLMIVQNVTSRYSQRTPEMYERIADCIHDITGERHGNYMVFFPSYAFLNRVADIFEIKYLGRDPSTVYQYPVPAWQHPSPFVQGTFELEGTEIAIARTPGEDEDRTSLQWEQYGAGTLPDTIREHSVPGSDITLLRQQMNMNEALREAFLRRFEIVSDEQSLLGFCTLGGIFSEGIDLREDALIGALIVGTGIPQVSHERDLLKQYFDERGENGYDYAYRFPGMNKVLQAAGRVIRTQDDVGIVALLDERFATASYRSLFPIEWSDYVVTTASEAPEIVSKFWDEWL